MLDSPLLGRREFLRVGVSGAAALVAAVAGCKLPLGEALPVDSRLRSRPHTPTLTIDPGLHELEIGGPRGASLYVPSGYAADRAWPLLVLLHGAGRSSTEWTGQVVRGLLDEYGIVLLAPSSREVTWHSNGFDTQFIDQALAWTFERCRVDPAYLGCGGFSDGASFGLSLGLANGDLFPELFGFSAGYLAGLGHEGHPRIFMSHGTSDAILPYSNAQHIADALQSSGYDVTFVSFDGGHTVQEPTARQAFEWFLRGRG